MFQISSAITLTQMLVLMCLPALLHPDSQTPFYLLSQTTAVECILKDTELNSCREFQNQQERDIAYWKSEALKLRVELG